MQLSDLTGKKICILGFGREGKATLEAIIKAKIDCDITVADKNENCQLSIDNYQFGPDYLKDLNRFDIIIKSPGIPPQPEFDAVKERITSATQIFLDSIEGTGAFTIGVTGSKGKSTTASLIAAILQAAGKDAHLIGNIGEPAIAHLDQAKEGTIFVMEMSSYQLMDLTRSPEIAVITSFFPEHLDYHGSLEAYKEAKKHIARFQRKGDMVFYPASQKAPTVRSGTNELSGYQCASQGYSSDGAKEIADAGAGTKIGFTVKDSPVQITETKLIGEHNVRNIAAAASVARHLHIEEETIVAVITSFEGLPHRLQSLGIFHGIEWIDDAISTTPESTIAAIDALGNRVVTIILGGQDRGSDFTELGKRIAASSIKQVILFPGSGPRIREAIEKTGAKLEFYEVKTMEEAVRCAKFEIRNSKSEFPICLLSTASPSYGMFKNFEEKGEKFKQYIFTA